MQSTQILKNALLAGDQASAADLINTICALELENVQLRQAIARTMAYAPYAHTAGGLLSKLIQEHAQLPAAEALPPRYAKGQTVADAKSFRFEIIEVLPNWNGTGHNAYETAMMLRDGTRYAHTFVTLEENLTLIADALMSAA